MKGAFESMAMEDLKWNHLELRNENIMRVEILEVRPSLISAQDPGTYTYFPLIFL